MPDGASSWHDTLVQDNRNNDEEVYRRNIHHGERQHYTNRNLETL